MGSGQKPAKIDLFHNKWVGLLVSWLVQNKWVAGERKGGTGAGTKGVLQTVTSCHHLLGDEGMGER